MNERPDANLIRICSDDELSPEQQELLRAFEQAHPDQAASVQSQIANEQRLKQRVQSVMECSCPCAPAILRAQICNQIQNESKRAQQRQPSRSMRLFANPHHANIFAVAATLALIAGAVLFGIFGRTIDDVARPGVVTDLVSDVAVFAEREHKGCASDSRGLMAKVEQFEPDAAGAYLSDWLGSAVTVFDLTQAGYEFIGASQCGVPVPARSGHLVYRKISNGDRRPMLSIFIVRDQGQCRGKLCKGLDRGKWCCLSESGVKCGNKILRGTDGQFVYFLICCKDQDLEQISKQIQLTSNATRSR